MASTNSVQVRGFRELEALLKKLPREIMQKALLEGLKAGAFLLRDASRSNLSGRLKNRSGNLRSNLVAQKGKGGLMFVQHFVLVRKKAYYGYFWEKGFHRVSRGRNKMSSGGAKRQGGKSKKVGKFEPARPFMRPAFDQNREAVIEAVANRVRKYLARL